jgi:hypothetical protein
MTAEENSTTDQTPEAQPPQGQEPEEDLTRQLLLVTPLYLLVPVLFAVLALIWEIKLEIGWILLGAAGWLIALILRVPVSIVAQRLVKNKENIQKVVILSSGPAEELIRLAVVLITAANLDIAYAIGLGWGGVEVLYALVNGFMIASLLKRTDEEALQAKETMEKMGLLQAGTKPLFGVAERLAVTALHIGFTLLLAFQPLLVLVTIPVHSLINYGFITMLRRRVPVTVIMLILIILGLAAFRLGLAAMLTP